MLSHDVDLSEVQTKLTAWLRERMPAGGADAPQGESSTAGKNIWTGRRSGAARRAASTPGPAANWRSRATIDSTGNSRMWSRRP